jgi:predicted metal-dependent hydrolase
MNFTQFGNKQIIYEIIRGTRKKTVSIHVGPDAVTIRAPQRLSEGKIRMIMQKKARCIIDRQERIKRESQLHPLKEFVSGESFPYLGRQYRLKVLKSVNGLSNTCHLMNGRLQVEISKNLPGEEAKNAVKETLINWYKNHAENKINERIPHLAQKLGREPAAVQIKDQKWRWGSCSRTGFIRFNWKIIMAPVSVLDYLIVHELCHLFHQNHSATYWEKVQTIIPDFRRKRDWLRDHSFIMGNFG